MKMAYVCNGSSVRAQLAAAIAKEYFTDADIVAVGSIEGEEADETAMKILEEDGISTKGLKLTNLFDMDFDLDYAIVVGCDEGGCPLVFAEKVIEWDFINNPKDQGEEAYRKAKDQLKVEIKTFYMDNFS